MEEDIRNITPVDSLLGIQHKRDRTGLIDLYNVGQYGNPAFLWH